MANPLIIPNWHVILIHLPLGVFMLGLVLEVALLIFRHHGAGRAASRWMVALGALASLPAAYAGMYALVDVTRRTAPPGVSVDGPWHAVAAASTLTAEQWQLLDDHAWKAGGAAVLAALLVTIGIGCSTRWRERLYPILLVLLLGCAAIMVVGSWYGGELVYRHGVGVSLDTRTDVHTAAAQTQPSAASKIDRYVDPMQLHVTLAGVAAAMGLFAIGLSLRAASTSPHWRDPELDRAGVTALPHPQRGGAYDVAMLRSFAPQVEVTGEIESVPAARFWLIVFLGAAATSLAGMWVLARGQQTYDPQALLKLVTADGYIRRLAHAIAGSAIVVLPLLMALLSRFARRSRATLSLFSLLLVAALAAQVWLGILLLFDQPKVTPGAGPWYRLQQPAAAASISTSSSTSTSSPSATQPTP